MFLGKRSWRQEKTCQTFFGGGGDPNCPFWACIIKISTFTFWCMVILLVHIWFTLSEGPKGFVKWIMEVGPWSHTMTKGHLPWSGLIDSPLLGNGFWCVDIIKTSFLSIQGTALIFLEVCIVYIIVPCNPFDNSFLLSSTLGSPIRLERIMPIA